MWGAIVLRLLILLSLAFVSICPESSHAFGRLVEMEWETTPGVGIRYEVVNLASGPITVMFDPELQGYESRVPLPVVFAIPENETREVILKEIPGANVRHSKWKYYASVGHPKPVHDDQVLYLLPYAPEYRFEVDQGFDGKFSHQGHTRYSIDWKMPIGTPIHAARGGIVASVKEDSDEFGESEEYLEAANTISILHDDGTVGFYVHIMQQGAEVKEGQRVKAGQFIGRSGHTGFSTGPHLHFEVYQAVNGRTKQSIPIRFMSRDGRPFVPVKDGIY